MPRRLIFLDDRVAAGEAQAHIVVQDVDAAPFGEAAFDHLHDRRLVGDVGRCRRRRAAFLLDHVDGVPRRFQVAVDRPHLRAFAREQQRCRPSVADGLPRRLPRADDDGDLVLEPHASFLRAVA